jgi:hypothetical protein
MQTCGGRSVFAYSDAFWLGAMRRDETHFRTIDDCFQQVYLRLVIDSQYLTVF